MQFITGQEQKKILLEGSGTKGSATAFLVFCQSKQNELGTGRMINKSSFFPTELQQIVNIKVSLGISYAS